MRIFNNGIHNIAPVRMSGVQKSNNIIFWSLEILFFIKYYFYFALCYKIIIKITGGHL